MDTRKVQLIFLCCCTFFLVLNLAEAKPRGPYEGNGMCCFNLAIPSDEFALRNKCGHVMPIRHASTRRPEKPNGRPLQMLKFSPFVSRLYFHDKNEIILLTVFQPRDFQNNFFQTVRYLNCIANRFTI